MSKEPFDEELMVLYQKGDLMAFEMLFRRHGRRVYSYLRKRSSEENARELTQEVFEKLHRHRERYKAQLPFRPWLFTITRNTLLDFMKRGETQLARREVGADFDRMASSDQAGEGRDLSPTIQTLDPPAKKIIELRYLKDWSFSQIAAEVGTSEANIRQIISRSIRKLKRRVGA